MPIEAGFQKASNQRAFSHFDRVGISFVLRDGIMWSTMIFYG